LKEVAAELNNYATKEENKTIMQCKNHWTKTRKKVTKFNVRFAIICYMQHTKKNKLYTTHLVGATKDVDQAFGVLQAFAIIHDPGGMQLWKVLAKSCMLVLYCIT
jgi:hypothetical protein